MSYPIEIQQPTADDVKEAVIHSLFGNALINNVIRALVVEAMVHKALGEEWKWVSGDWAPYDFLHADGTKLEVKQSAARQSWHVPTNPPSKALFDIAERKGSYDGSVWSAGLGRAADLYVFGNNPRFDEGADHRDPGQWRFYVVKTTELPAPPRRSISGAALSKLCEPVAIDRLHEEVTRQRMLLCKPEPVNV